MNRFIDIFAVAVLVLFFLLGLLGNQQGEGQLYLQVVLAVIGIMALGWLANQLKTAVAGSIADWRRLSVAQAKMAIIANEDDDESLDITAGLEALERKDYRMAAAAFWFDAEAGGSVGQYYLSKLFRRGHGVPHSREEAIKWLRRSAGQGLVEAQAELGDAYLTGWHGTINKDYAEALEWLHKAADKGNDYACNRIGVMFEKGLGVRRDCSEAANWYRRSAERGDWRGQHSLGKLYLHGKGMSRDLVQAYVWLRLGMEGARKADAATHGVGRDLSDAQGQMTPGQLSESRWLVGQWEDRMNQPEEEGQREQRRIRRRRRQALAVPIIDRIRAEITKAVEGHAEDELLEEEATASADVTEAPDEPAETEKSSTKRGRADRKRRRAEAAAKEAEEKVENASSRLDRALRRKGKQDEAAEPSEETAEQSEDKSEGEENVKADMRRMAQDRMAARRRRREAAEPEKPELGTQPEAVVEDAEEVEEVEEDARGRRRGRGRSRGDADPVRAKAEAMMASLSRQRGPRGRSGRGEAQADGAGSSLPKEEPKGRRERQDLEV